jgi:hypothetical protein
MTKSVLFGVTCVATVASSAHAVDLLTATMLLPSGQLTTSGHSDEWKTGNALSAGPASIADHAAVIDWPKHGSHE